MGDDINPNEFVDAETFNSSDEEFYDFDDDDGDDDRTISMMPGEMLLSFLPQDDKVEENHFFTSFDISMTIKRATLTLLHQVDPIASSNIFFGTFDINQMHEVLPSTPHDHTTLFFADLSTTLI